MAYYADLQVSQKETTICVVDEHGRRLWRGKAAAHSKALALIQDWHCCDPQVGVTTGRCCLGSCTGCALKGILHRRLAMAGPSGHRDPFGQETGLLVLFEGCRQG